MPVQLDNPRGLRPAEGTVFLALQATLDKVRPFDQDVSDLSFRVTVASPGTSHASLVDPADHGNFGVDVRPVTMAGPPSAEVVQFAVDRLPAGLVVPDRLSEADAEIRPRDGHGHHCARL